MINANIVPEPHLKSTTLSYIERLILHALRQWVTDQKRWPGIVLEFNRACGPRAATQICDALQTTFRTLGLHARRHIRLHPPTSCRISQDELCLLNIHATHQSQSTLHCQALINWMVPRGATALLLSDIDQVARSLFDAGYVLDVRRTSVNIAAPLEQQIQSVH